MTFDKTRELKALRVCLHIRVADYFLQNKLGHVTHAHTHTHTHTHTRSRKDPAVHSVFRIEHVTTTCSHHKIKDELIEI